MSWNNKNQAVLDSGVNRVFWDTFVSPMMIKLRGNKCELCKSTKRLVVHHTDYNVQTINTLQVLCFNCHMKVHKKGCKQQ